MAERPATCLFDPHAAPDSIAFTIDMNIDIRPFTEVFSQHREGAHRLIDQLNSMKLDSFLRGRKYRLLFLRSSLLPMHGKVDLMDTEDGRYVTTDDLVNELLRILNHKVKAGECDTKDSDALAARDWRSPKDVLRHVDFSNSRLR